MTDQPAPPKANYASYPSLVDRAVFVTGGADGIGASLVEQFALQGSRVGFADINAEKAADLVVRCADLEIEHEPKFYEVDLVDVPALQRIIAQAQVDLDGITVLVNNAANDERHTWDEVTPEYWDDRLNTNLRHYFFAIQAVAPRMIEAGNGSIINIGSSSYMMQEDFFPVPLRGMGARFDFWQPDLTEHTGEWGNDWRVLRHSHPGGAYTYRFAEEDKTIVYCTDIEHGDVIGE